MKNMITFFGWEYLPLFACGCDLWQQIVHSAQSSQEEKNLVELGMSKNGYDWVQNSW
jgi:hypothetical protein